MSYEGGGIFIVQNTFYITKIKNKPEALGGLGAGGGDLRHLPTEAHQIIRADIMA